MHVLKSMPAVNAGRAIFRIQIAVQPGKKKLELFQMLPSGFSAARNSAICQVKFGIDSIHTQEKTHEQSGSPDLYSNLF